LPTKQIAITEVSNNKLFVSCWAKTKTLTPVLRGRKIAQVKWQNKPFFDTDVFLADKCVYKLP